MTHANDGDADIGEGRGDRRMRLVHGHAHLRNLAETIEHGFGDGAGRSLDQSVATLAKRLARDFDDLIISDGVRELVGLRGLCQIDIE